MQRALRQALWLLCAGTCGCGEDVLQLGRYQPPPPLAVESLLLRQAETGRLITDLASGTPISVAGLPSTNVNLEAVTIGNPGSVEFMVDGDTKREHVVPFTYPGDTDGKLSAFTALVGEHTVSATPYSLLDAQGERGTALTRTLTFIK